MKHIRIVLYLILISGFILPTFIYGQRGNAEIILYNDSDDSETFDASAQSRLRWESTDSGSSWSTTSSYNDVSSVTVAANTGGPGYGWDWANDPNLTGNGEVTNSLYKVWINPSKYIYIDFRDDRYPYLPFCTSADMEIRWDGSGWSVCDAGETPESVSNGGTAYIWTIFDKGSQSYTDFKVPITVNTNNDGYGLDVEVAGTDEDSPYSNTTTYTKNNTFEIDYDHTQTTASGYKFSFSSWSDAGAQSHDVTISSLDDAKEWTATVNKYIPVPGSFALGTQSDHPHLTWTSVTGTAMGGYKIERNYNGGGYSVVATIGTPSTTSWTDEDIDWDNGGNTVYYKMRTMNNNEPAEYSDYTLAESCKGYFIPRSRFDNEVTSIRFGLDSNNPNPFNPSTSINYNLAIESQVTLSIYNVLGERIRSLVSATKSKGSFSEVWDSRDDRGRQVAAGIYIYRLEAIPLSGEDRKPFIDSRKMLLTN